MTSADPKRLCVSFSGGETSAYLAQWVKRSNEFRSQYDEVVFVFANTGQEHEATLEFADRCDKAFGLNLVWVEAVVHHEQRQGTTHRVVDLQTASRGGEPFEAAVQKYGVPNYKFPHCTRELKERPITSYLRSIGWGRQYETAIGIRKDEIDRVSPTAAARGLVYPLVSLHPRTKAEINDWWKAQPFRLPLHSWEGNCKWCWKKSLRKHLFNLQTNPVWYDFPERMERAYPRVGAEFKKDPSARDRTFFRGNRSVADLRATASKTPVGPPDDSNDFDPDLDAGGGCGDSCEVFTDTDEQVTEWEGVFE